MLSKEEIKTCKEEARNYIEFMETAGDNAGWTRGLIWYIDQLETDKQKLIEINNKYLQKLVYALTPTKHALGDDYNNAFKKIIAENIDLETCKIKRKLKECWGIDKKF